MISLIPWRAGNVKENRSAEEAALPSFCDSKLFSYVYYHKGLVDEGLICGDRYQSIALHENILFSYFEEPRGSVNIKKDYEHDQRYLRSGWQSTRNPTSSICRKAKAPTLCSSRKFLHWE